MECDYSSMLYSWLHSCVQQILILWLIFKIASCMVITPLNMASILYKYCLNMDTVLWHQYQFICLWYPLYLSSLFAQDNHATKQRCIENVLWGRNCSNILINGLSSLNPGTNISHWIVTFAVRSMQNCIQILGTILILVLSKIIVVIIFCPRFLLWCFEVQNIFTIMLNNRLVTSLPYYTMKLFDK